MQRPANTGTLPHSAEPPRTPLSLGPDAFGPTRKRTPAGHAAEFDRTEERLDRLLDRVPITRVYDATPLDVLGLPVWCAVTPLAADLTVHTGKGATPQAARISAVMEGIERTCGETVDDTLTIRASYASLATAGTRTAVDPARFDLPFDTTYRPDREIRWVLGYDLLAERHAYVPHDLVVSPAPRGLASRVETNGLAAGNTLTEATLHALYEVVERHVVAEVRYHDLYHDPADSSRIRGRMVDVRTLPPDFTEWTGRIRGAGLDMVVRDVTGEPDVPVFIVYLTNDSFPGAEGEIIAFAGYGADLDPARAVFRAVTEAVQSHTGAVLGARDTFEGEGVTSERTAMLLRHVSILCPDTLDPFPDTAAGSADLYADLREVLARLRRSGLENCVVVNLTRADLGIPVVRVLVPGLAPPYGESTRRPGLRLLRNLV